MSPREKGGPKGENYQLPQEEQWTVNQASNPRDNGFLGNNVEEVSPHRSDNTNLLVKEKPEDWCPGLPI